MAKKTDKHMITAIVRRMVIRDGRGIFNIVGITKDAEPAIEGEITKGDGSKAPVIRTKLTPRMVLYEELDTTDD